MHLDLNNTFKIINGGVEHSWSQKNLEERLAGLAHTNKKITWICSDLGTTKSSCFGRMFWTIVAKYFNWMRQRFYNIDLEKSKEILKQLQPQIEAKNDWELIGLFNKAVTNFNDICPHYQGNLAHRQNLAERLQQAFQEEHPSIAAWCLLQGASLDALKDNFPDLSPSQQTLLDWLQLQVDQPNITAKNLDHFALKMGLGYKSANLMLMQAQEERISAKLKTCIVKIPPFLAVSDFEIQQQLRKEVPTVFTLWNTFLEETFDPKMKEEFLDIHKTNQEAAKVPIKISEKGKKILDEIKDLIVEYFQNKPYFTRQMWDWIKKHYVEYITSRSTGKEDSDTNANAGGNESILSVNAKNDTEISDAIGHVIASYFDKESITQRLSAGQRDLFTDEKPFMPVLLQKMIGENIDGIGSQNEDIPRCVISLSREPGKAKEVTFIQAVLGQNNVQASMDSYFVKKNRVHSIVRKQETRLVSTTNKLSGRLEAKSIKNTSSDSICAQALPNSVILDIKSIADHISLIHGGHSEPKPMNMEYIVKLKEAGHNKPVIYLVQAKPIDIQENANIKHTYLDSTSLKQIPAEKKMQAELLLDGGAYVRQIKGYSSMLFTNDLPEGLSGYLDADDPANIQVIVIKKRAPATSHEASTLHSKGIAVLVVDDPKEFARLKLMAQQATVEKPLLIDMQRGMLTSTTGGQDPKKLIQEGLITYPIPSEVTVPPSGLMTFFNKANHLGIGSFATQLFFDNANKWIRTLKGDQALLPIATKKHAKSYSVRELLDLIATGAEREAELALATLLNLLKTRLLKSVRETECFRANINQPMLQVFEAALLLIKREIAPALKQHKPQSLERLFPLKFLEAMIFQKFSARIMGAKSYAQVLQTDSNQKKEMEILQDLGIDYSGNNDQLFLHLSSIMGLGFNDECVNEGLQFVKELSELPTPLKDKAIKEIYKHIVNMHKIEMTGIWVNTVLKNAWKISDNNDLKGSQRVQEVLKQLQEVENNNAAAINWISERITTLQIFDQQVTQWNDPKFVEKHTSGLYKTFTQELGFNPSSLKNLYNGSEKFGRLALLQYLRQAVDIYDSIIKTVKGSTQFKNDEAKADAEGELLKGIREIMKASFTLLPKEIELFSESEDENERRRIPISLDQYIQRLEEGLTYRFGYSVDDPIGATYISPGLNHLIANVKNSVTDAAKQFEARPQFNVAALIIGSGADVNFSAHWPDRLEEYLSVFHQNTKQVVKRLNTENGMDTTLLSDAPKEICDQVEKKFKQKLSFLTFEKGKIHVGYQIPLRQHSASLEIIFNPKKPEQGIDIKLQMFGGDEFRRWDLSAAFGAVLAYYMVDGFSDGTPPKINYAKPEGVTIALHLSQGFKKIPQLIETIYYIATKMTSFNIDNGHSLYSTDLLGIMQDGTKGNYSVGKRAAGMLKEKWEFSGIGLDDWSQVGEECFASSFILNVALMDKFKKANDSKMLLKVATYSLLGLASNGTGDYTRGKFDRSLKDEAVQALKNLIDEESSATAKVSELITNPDMLERFPAICYQLKTKIAIKPFPPNDAFAKFIKDQQYVNAYIFAHQSKDATCLDRWNEVMGSIFTAKNYDLLFQIIMTLYIKGHQELAAPIINNDFEKYLTSEQKEELQKVQNLEARRQRYKNIDDNTLKIRNLAKEAEGFSANSQEILSLSAKILIGLSQGSRNTYNKSEGEQYSGLDEFLGKSSYKYVNMNTTSQTDKARVAASLYIIKGLNANSSSINAHACQAFKSLVEDYVFFKKVTLAKEMYRYSKHIHHYRDDIFAITRAYLDTYPGPLQEAAKSIAKTFKYDADVLSELIDSEQIPVGAKKAALFEQLLLL